jgi:hypothetical protein
MAQASVFEQGLDRFQETVKDLDHEVQKVRKQLVKRRRSLEKELRTRRQRLERRAERQVRRIRTELRRNSAYRRVEDFQADARKRIGDQIDQVFSAIPIASRGDIASLDRKVARLTRRVRELEKTNGSSEA